MEPEAIKRNELLAIEYALGFMNSPSLNERARYQQAYNNLPHRPVVRRHAPEYGCSVCQ